MTDMLSTGVSGLLAFETALNTISNNISNANTPGYDQEVANLVTNPYTQASEGWIGTGVNVSSVTRQYNQFLTAQLNSSTSSYNQFNALSSLASNIDNMFSDSTTGLSATLQSFSQAVQTMANSPSDSSARQAVLSQAQTLISQFQSYQTSLTQLGAQANDEISSEAATINSLGQSIASLNQQISQAQNNGTGQPPNQLLDQRDTLINQLSQDVGVTTVDTSDGSINVFIGNGQPLVVGASSSSISAQPDQFGSGQQQIVMQGASGSVNISNSISGGSLGGLLQFQQQMLTPAENTLGQAAITFTQLVNTQNQAGLDLNGDPGQALLAVGGPQVLPSDNNTGNAQVAASVSDLGGLTSSNYYLRYDGSNWSLTDTASGAATTLTSSSPGTLTGAGMTFTLTGTAKAGNEFLVEPTSSAVNGMSLLTTNPALIAAAAPLVASATAGNTGTASVQSATVPDLSNWTQGDYTLTFIDATDDYTVTDENGNQVGSGTYTRRLAD